MMNAFRLAKTLSTVGSQTIRRVSTGERTWKVFLSGEIHSDWRDVIAQGVAEKNLPVALSSPNTSHEDSDDCGAIILGMQEERPNWDKLGANMNGIRTRTLLQEADIVVVRFGDKYRQWNAACTCYYYICDAGTWIFCMQTYVNVTDALSVRHWPACLV